MPWRTHFWNITHIKKVYHNLENVFIIKKMFNGSKTKKSASIYTKNILRLCNKANQSKNVCSSRIFSTHANVATGTVKLFLSKKMLPDFVGKGELMSFYSKYVFSLSHSSLSQDPYPPSYLQRPVWEPITVAGTGFWRQRPLWRNSKARHCPNRGATFVANRSPAPPTKLYVTLSSFCQCFEDTLHWVHDVLSTCFGACRVSSEGWVDTKFNLVLRNY